MAINNTIAILACLLILAGIGTQFAGYMNLDNAWLLHVAQSVISGQKLHLDVIESNPPLIVYIMKLPVYMGKLLGIGSINGFIVFIGILAAISLALAFRVVKDNRIRLSLVFATLFMAASNYGEREHIFIILILPYLVSFWQKDKLPTLYLLVAALMAGIAFCIKPFFILILMALVLTRMVLDRKLLGFITLPNIIIGFIITAYPLYLVFIEKTYVNQVLPLMLKYYGGYNTSSIDIAKESASAILLGQVAFWILYIKDKSALTRPIYITNFANLAAIAVIAVQGKLWANYFYPPDFFSFLTNAMITFALFDGNVKPLWNKVAAILSSFMMAIFLTMAIAVNLKMAFHIREDYETKIINIFNEKAAGKNVMALTFDVGATFPGIMHSKANYSSRYAHFWMLPGIYSGEKTVNGFLEYHKPEQMQPDEAKVINDVIEDFKTTKPELVVVVRSEYSSPVIGSYKFDFVDYFSQNKGFKEIWSNYKKIATIGEDKDKYWKDIYQLQ